MRCGILISALIACTYAVQRTNFRTCSQTNFCSRQRGSEASDYAIDPSSLNARGSSFEWKLASPTAQDDLTLSVSRVNNAFRILVSETKSLHPRYTAHDDILVPGGRTAVASRLEQGGDHVDVVEGDFRLRVMYNPAQFILIYKEKEYIHSNALNRMYFESYRERRDDDEEGLWQESWSTHTDHNDKGPAGLGLDFTFIDSQFVYGLPEHASSFALKETNGGDQAYSDPFRLYNLDVFEYELNEPMALYGAIPFVISHTPQKSAAVFWLNAAETFVDVLQTPRGRNVRFMSETGVLETYLFAGDSPAHVLDQYTSVSGRPFMAPLWSVGFHQCRWNYNDEDDVEGIHQKFEEHDIPVDVVWLDIEHTDGKRYFTWDSHTFGSPDVMQEKLAATGRKMVTIVDPHIKKDDNYYVYKDIFSRDLFIKDRDNNVFEGWCWPGTSCYPDFLNPAMQEFWMEQFAFNKYVGSTPHLFTWNDMNEPSVFNGPEVTMHKTNKHFGGWEHRDVHNVYGYYVHKATFLGLQKRQANVRPFVLTRAFFAGSQRYGAVWSGDNMASWEHLRASVPMLLSMSVSGLPFVGADVGGFFGNPDAELMTRWMQLGIYYPFFRSHAHKDSQRREPWIFEQAWLQKQRSAIVRRYEILPYLYTLFYESHQTGNAIMRPLWWEFTSDVTSFGRDDAFLLGDAMYIHPICEAGTTSVNVRLPGNAQEIWYDFRRDTGECFAMTGSEHRQINGLENFIPAFYRGGKIVPLRERVRRSSVGQMNDPITLVIAPDQQGNADGSLYLDDGNSYDFESKRQFLLVSFTLRNNQLSIAPTHANFKLPKTIVVERIYLLGSKLASLTKATIGERTVNIEKKSGYSIVPRVFAPLKSANAVSFG